VEIQQWKMVSGELSNRGKKGTSGKVVKKRETFGIVE
jgi:hypothetical protein